MANLRKFDKEKKFPLRTEQKTFDQLELISRIESKSVNDSINDALEVYIKEKIKNYGGNNNENS